MRRLALVSSLAVLSVVAFLTKARDQALAQNVDFGGSTGSPGTQDINFNGNINGTCTFSNTLPGTLVAAGSNSPWVEASGPNPSSPLAAIASRGRIGVTNVRCISGAQITVAVPVRIAAPAGFIDTSRQAAIVATEGGAPTANTSASTGGTFPGFPSSNTAPIPLPANTTFGLSVGMAAGQNSGTGTAPTGTYSYRVTITATPN